MTRKEVLLAGALGAAFYFLRPEAISREAVPVEVAKPPAPPATVHRPTGGLWISPAELAALPPSGSAPFDNYLKQ